MGASGDGSRDRTDALFWRMGLRWEPSKAPSRRMTFTALTPRSSFQIPAHPHVRPGDEPIKKYAALYKFMNWDGPILTDSGAWCLFPASYRHIKEEGDLPPHIDGHKIFMGPEVHADSVEPNSGSIAMAF